MLRCKCGPNHGARLALSTVVQGTHELVIYLFIPHIIIARMPEAERTGFPLAVDCRERDECADQHHQIRQGQQQPLPIDVEHGGSFSFVLCANVFSGSSKAGGV